MENYDPKYQALILNMIQANRNPAEQDVRKYTEYFFLSIISNDSFLQPPTGDNESGPSTSQQPPAEARPVRPMRNVQPSTSYEAIEIAAHMRGKYRTKQVKKSDVVLVADADSTTATEETSNDDGADDMEIEEMIYSGIVESINRIGEHSGASLEDSEAEAKEYGPTRSKRPRRGNN